MFDPWIIYVGVSVGVGIALRVTELLARDHRLAFLAKRPRVPIANAAEGQAVRIAGRLALAEPPLVAPLTGRQCAYYEVTVEEHEAGNESSGGGWAMRNFEWASRDFTIEDETGRSLVRAPRGVLLDIDATAKARRFSTPPPELAAYLGRLMARHDPPLIGDLRKVRVREGVLEPGERVNVLGVGRWEADTEATGYREAARRLVISPLPSGEMLVTDKKP